MPKIKKGNTSANNVSGVTTFNLCKMAGHALYCTKFCEIISKNAGGATVVNVCTSYVMLYISTKFCEIISNRIKVIGWTRFLY